MMPAVMMKMQTNSKPMPASWIPMLLLLTSPNSVESGSLLSSRRSRRTTRRSRRNRSTGSLALTSSKNESTGGTEAAKSTSVSGFFQNSNLKSAAHALNANSHANRMLYASWMSSRSFMEMRPVYQLMSSLYRTSHPPNELMLYDSRRKVPKTMPEEMRAQYPSLSTRFSANRIRCFGVIRAFGVEICSSGSIERMRPSAADDDDDDEDPDPAPGVDRTASSVSSSSKDVSRSTSSTPSICPRSSAPTCMLSQTPSPLLDVAPG
mmetsp:Transcript_5044/g.20607  ORF Transcript_5044/g.20607 Transcript_5044/m.20607 type:complete len:264 (+) Transcript_5044:953-1744(+)